MRLFQCDWCNAIYESRDSVASVDVTVGAHTGTYHMCAACAPDFLVQEFDPGASTKPLLGGAE